MQYTASVNHPEEGPALRVFFDGNHCESTRESEDSNDEDNTSPQSPPNNPPKPHTTYAKRVPGPSTAIAAISYKRLDRIPPAHAARTDACLICTARATPSTALSLLPCSHAWCSECLARAFHFVLGNQAFGRLQCCGKEDIPLGYFARIVEERERAPVEFEVLPDAARANVDADAKAPWTSTRVVEYVEKDQPVFISAGDIASYQVLLEEHHAPARRRIYCHGPGCGAYIPQDCRTAAAGKCASCSRTTCLKCRRNAKTHAVDARTGKCKASKCRLGAAENEAKLLALAKRKGWKRCPRCRMFVQKVRVGCASVVCLCGRSFFYG